jgi:hypothetical protein
MLNNSVFWDITPCSPLKVKRCFVGIYRFLLQCPTSRTRYQRGLPAAFNLVSCSAYSTLKMEAICSSETSLDFQRITRRYIPDDSSTHNHRCKNLKSYAIIQFLPHCKYPVSPFQRQFMLFREINKYFSVNITQNTYIGKCGKN